MPQNNIPCRTATNLKFYLLIRENASLQMAGYRLLRPVGDNIWFSGDATNVAIHIRINFNMFTPTQKRMTSWLINLVTWRFCIFDFRSFEVVLFSSHQCLLRHLWTIEMAQDEHGLPEGLQVTHLSFKNADCLLKLCYYVRVRGREVDFLVFE